MKRLALPPSEMETVKACLRAAVEGAFFADWEFQTLTGLERCEVREVYENFPNQTVPDDEFEAAIVGSMNHLLGYPHGMEAELGEYVPEGVAEIARVLAHLTGEASYIANLR